MLRGGGFIKIRERKESLGSGPITESEEGERSGPIGILQARYNPPLHSTVNLVLKMERVFFSETLASTYDTTTPKATSTSYAHRENLRSHITAT
jgi:hypothetical protein